MSHNKFNPACSPAMKCKTRDAYCTYQPKCFFLQARIIYIYIQYIFIFSNDVKLCASVSVLWTQNWSVNIFHEWNLGQIKAIFRLSEGLGSRFGVCLPTTPQSPMWGASWLWMGGVWDDSAVWPVASLWASPHIPDTVPVRPQPPVWRDSPWVNSRRISLF